MHSRHPASAVGWRTTSSVILASLAIASSTLPVAAQDAEPKDPVPESSIARNFSKTGDPDGRRAALAARGVTFGINYNGEVFGVAAGGIRTGARYSGQLEGIVDVDLEKMAGWRGATLHMSGFQLHGRGLSASHVGLLNPVSNIEATPATRLFELWFEQELVKDKLSVRLGQMRVDYDGEFINSQTAGIFLNTNFGWPAFTGLNLPSGGVTYPLAAMGLRAKYTPSPQWAFLLGVFNDDPAGPCAGDPQVCNNDGLKFRLKDPAFVIGEVQYKYNDGKAPGALKGQVKLGAFLDKGFFDHKRFDENGLSLADPASSGTPRRLRNDRAVYAVIDQQIYRGKDDTGGIFAFGRIAGLPSDRNTVAFTIDGGLRFTGMVPGRAADEFGIGLAYNKISSSIAGLDRDTAAFSGAPVPIHSSEVVGEVTYRAELAKGWYLQPSAQYIWRPGGNAADPNSPAKPIDNAVVLGLRSTINY